MGCSPCDSKESDTTELLSTMVLVLFLVWKMQESEVIEIPLRCPSDYLRASLSRAQHVSSIFHPQFLPDCSVSGQLQWVMIQPFQNWAVRNTLLFFLFTVGSLQKVPD